MPNGRLDIGNSIGEAAVWNPLIPVQQFNSLVMQKKARTQAENDALAAELSKVKSDGLRNDADRQEFFKRYENIKNTAISTRGERDPLKKAMAKAQIKDELLRLQDYANRSKEQGAKEADWAKAYMANPVAWGDNSLKAYQQSAQSPLDAPTLVKDFTTLQRQPDVDKINKDLSGLIAGNLKQQVWKTNRSIGKKGNMAGTYETDMREVNPEDIYKGAVNYYDLHPDFQRQLQTQYADLYAQNDPKQAKALAIKDYIDQGIQSGAFGASKEYGKEEFTPDKVPDNWKEKYDYRRANPIRSGGDSGVIPDAPQDLDIPYKEGAGSVRTKGYVRVNSAPLNLAGSPSYNLTTGEVEPKTLSSGDYQLVGVTNVPFIKTNVVEKLKNGKKGKNLKGAIANGDFATQRPNDVEYRPMLHVQIKDMNGFVEDKFVPYDRIPKNVTKATREAIAGFKPYNQQTTPAGTPLNNKNKKAATDYGL